MRSGTAHMLLRPRQILAPVIFATVFGYFGYHLVNGDRGLLAMAHLQRETQIADQNLAEAETTRKIWERRLGALRNQSLDTDMLLIRRFEERAGQLYGMGLIGGFCHLYIGQEAVVVGMQSVIVEKDAIVTSYRDHGHMLAAGMDPKGVMSELTGRSGGYSKGKGGSMHMFSRAKKFY